MTAPARVIQVIETNLLSRGMGQTNNPFRRIRQYWSLDGKFLAEVDSWNPTKHAEDKESPDD